MDLGDGWIMAYKYELPPEIRTGMEPYRKFLGPIGYQRFEEWMEAEFKRGFAKAMEEEGY